MFNSKLIKRIETIYKDIYNCIGRKTFFINKVTFKDDVSGVDFKAVFNDD